MLANKERAASPRDPALRTELDYLYARRSAIDTLIESLEEYARVGLIGAEESGRQTA